jgi:hypothetical protein
MANGNQKVGCVKRMFALNGLRATKRDNNVSETFAMAETSELGRDLSPLLLQSEARFVHSHCHGRETPWVTFMSTKFGEILIRLVIY